MHVCVYYVCMYVSDGGVSYILGSNPALESMPALFRSWCFVAKMSVMEKMLWRCDNINEE